MSSEDPPLDLARLDRAIGPVRRVVGYAMRTDALPPFLEANTKRHLDLALGLELPAALHDVVAAVAGHADGFDAAAAEEKRTRLSGMYAHLNRIDAIAGLPLPTKRLKAVVKPVQRDEPEKGSKKKREPDEGGAAPAAEAREGKPRKKAKGKKDRQKPRGPRLLDEVSTAVDPAVTQALERIGVRTLRDVLWLRPQGVATLAVSSNVTAEQLGNRVAVGGSITTSWSILAPTGERAMWSGLSGAVPLRVQWSPEAFSSVLASGSAEPARGLVVTGTVSAVSEEGTVTLVDARPVSADDGTVHVASYGVEGVSDTVLRQLVGRLLASGQAVADPVPPKTLAEANLASREVALRRVHTGHEEGRRRLAYDEALWVQLAGLLPKARGGRGLPHKIVHGFTTTAGRTRDFVLDDDQQRCFEEIKRSLKGTHAMRHVLTGEVGAGKGAVALRAITMVAEGRSQVLVVADDDVGAAERFLHSEPMLREAGFVSKLLRSPPTTSQRDALRRGEVHVAFGTPELLEQKLEFRRLGLVVAMEREDWGRAARLCDALPAPNPDLLTVTLLPVGPRVLFTAFAQHQVEVLTDAHRRPARITLLGAEERSEAYQHVRDAVHAGNQAVIVFPMVAGRDALDVREALRVVRALQSDALEGLSVGLFHGSMPPDERRRVHQDFEHRRLDVLVATTRLEEGQRVPGATLVVVEQAESVDAWRLHRIIGFFSRAPADGGHAVLVAGSLASSEATARLERLRDAPSGAALTELRIARTGLEASVAEGGAPWPTLRWLDLERDLDLAMLARRQVQEWVRADPTLKKGPAVDVVRELAARWSDLWPDADPESWRPPVVDGSGVEGRRRRRRRRRRNR